MKYFSRMVLLALGLMLVGCSANQAIDPSNKGTQEKSAHSLVEPIPQSTKAVTPAGHPPLPIVSTQITSVHVVQSSYCRDMLGCADYVGGRAMLNGEPPTVIDPGDRISIATWLTEDGKYTLNQTSAVFAIEIM